MVLLSRGEKGARWTVWKVSKVTVIRGDRRERQQRGKRHVECVYFQWRLQEGQENKKGFFFPFLKYLSFSPPWLTQLVELQNIMGDSRADLDSQGLRNVTICLRNIWLSMEYHMEVNLKCDSEIWSHGWISRIYEIADIFFFCILYVLLFEVRVSNFWNFLKGAYSPQKIMIHCPGRQWPPLHVLEPVQFTFL